MFVRESLCFPSLSKTRNFIGYRIMGWHFFLSILKDVTLLSSCLHGFWWEVCCSSYPSSSVGKVFHFPLAALKIFSLSLFSLSVNMLRCVYGCFFVCVFLHLFCLVFVARHWFWKIFGNYFFQYFFCTVLSFSSSVSFMHMLYDLVLFQALGCFALLYSFFFFLFQFYCPIFCFRWNGILIILCPIFNFNDFFLYCVKFTDESAKGILHVFCFWSWHFHLILSYSIHLCWSCMLPTFSMRAFNIWISYFKCPIW